MTERRETYELIRQRAERFFMSYAYPPTVLFFVLCGYITGLEFYFNIIILLSLSAALCVSHSIRPFIVVLLSYVYQLSIGHCPSLPANSDYYFTGARIVVVVLMFVLVACATVYFFVSRRLLTREALYALPIKLAALLLSIAFLMNGAFGGEYTPSSLGYGAIQIVAFLLVFYVFYLGFKNEDGETLAEYFSYVSALIALVLVIETVFVYVSRGVIVDGEAVKDKILYGWGIWNTAGQIMTATIPVTLYGAMRLKRPILYFGVATLTLCAVMLTLSRSSLAFAALSYATCCIIACFFGNNKRFFRIVTPLCALAVLVGGILLWDKIGALLSDLLERGFSDNGRFDLYKYGIDSFLESPVFGKGFFGLHTDTFVVAEFFPEMMHSTPIQILAAMGAVGLFAYAFYRIETVRAFLSRPTLAKTLIGISLFTLLGQSLVDNFVFYIQPMFHYSIALAIVYRINAQERQLHRSVGISDFLYEKN